MSARRAAAARSSSTERDRATDSTPADLTIRPARACDLVPLQFFFDTALRRDYFVRRGQLAELIADERHTVLVAELDGVLVGVAILTRGARLVNALVHPAYRGLGIGRRLIVESGAVSVRVKLDMSTGDPRGFYERTGFRSTGRRSLKGNVELLVRHGLAAKSGETTRAEGATA